MDSPTFTVQPRSSVSTSKVIGRLDAQSRANDDRAPSPQEDQNESVSGRLIPLEVGILLEKKSSSSQSRDRAWRLISRHVTADQASSHVDLLEPALRLGLLRAAFQGQYMIQVGFNETMLQQGTLLEEIHLLLDGDLQLRERDICMIFAPIFAPFPGIVFTPGETFYVPIDAPSQGIPGRRLELQGSSGNSGTTSVQGTGASEDTGKGSDDQNKKPAKDNSRSHRKTPDGKPNPGDSSSDDDEDDKGKRGSRPGPKGKGRQRGPRVINIPFQSTLLTTGPNGECDQFITSAGFDITVCWRFPVRFNRG